MEEGSDKPSGVQEPTYVLARRQDKERRLSSLEQELVAAAKGRKIELPVADIRREGLLVALRERARQK